MVASLPDSDCDSSSESCAPTSGPFSSIGYHVYSRDSSNSNLSCSSSSTDSATTENSTGRSSWDRRISTTSSYRNSKPHKAQDAAWTAIRGLRLREGRVTLNHFKLLRQVGHGDIGNVYLTQLTGTACIFAIKVMDKDALSQRNKFQRMQNERQILEHLDHPFLPTLYAAIDTKRFSCLVMEYCPGGDLHSLRQRQRDKRFGLKATRFYAAEVLVTLEYLHMMGVIYRDLKPENILLRENGHIMLTDFDLSLQCDVKPKVLKYPITSSRSCPFRSLRSRKLQSYVSRFRIRRIFSCLSFRGKTRLCKCSRPSKPKLSYHKSPNSVRHSFSSFPQLIVEPEHARSMSFVGTHEYLAPEIISSLGHGSPVDWWAFGILLYELLLGRTPFKGNSNKSTLMNIIKQPLRFPEEADIEVGEAAKSLIQGLLVKDPRNRLGSVRGAAEVKQHRFFRGINWALIRSAKPPEFPRKDWAFLKKKANVSGHTINEKLAHSNEKKVWTMSNAVCQSLPNFDYF